ncbi:kinase-like protein [Lepidopterella palustris CBS 459.81]|uniref:Kinase-like protein n=1 Tax=Lepidopterella palustris CBS 459.81 TaxID=1314670 RepID=A0A8E2EER0_9PEZI|nr:kinase-like protein [Lepidopterella palustris CBS 459.81]
MAYLAEVRTANKEGRHEQELSQLFPLNETGYTSRTKPFCDADFVRISAVLVACGRPLWAKLPRTYSILRLIGELSTMPAFVEKDVTDLFIPYTHDNLPSSLAPCIREKFIRIQHLVLTDTMNLERGSTSQHLHVSSKEDLQFETKAVLGKGGGCSVVEKVYSPLGCREYALKLIRRSKTFRDDKEALATFEKELANAQKVTHHHVVEIVGSFTERRYVGIIMSTIGECNLKDFLEAELSSDGKSILRTFFGCLSSGLIALHNASIRHKDIKPANIIVRHSSVFFTDFGLALDWSEKTRSTTGGKPALFTPRYCAPEVANWDDRNCSSDVWSLGAVYLEMVSVLLGQSVNSLRSYLENHGTEISSQYCRNLEGIEHWIKRLDSGPGSTDDRLPLKWVNECMAATQGQRLTAHQLWEAIDKDTAEAKQPFACTTCTAHFDDSEPPSGSSSPITPSSTSLSTAGLNALSRLPNVPTNRKETTPKIEGIDIEAGNLQERLQKDCEAIEQLDSIMFKRYPRVVVTNLPEGTTEQDLLQEFSFLGILSAPWKAWVDTDVNTGLCTGRGFVLFHFHTHAERAVAVMNGQQVGMNLVQCTLVLPEPPRRITHPYYTSPYYMEHLRSGNVRLPSLPRGASWAPGYLENTYAENDLLDYQKKSQAKEFQVKSRSHPIAHTQKPPKTSGKSSLFGSKPVRLEKESLASAIARIEEFSAGSKLRIEELLTNLQASHSSA